MILEHALLRVRPGEGEAFEAAMHSARPLIETSPGFRFIEVCPAAEEAELFLLLVGWEDIASHRDGFRRSDRYKEWRDRLHRFYDPVPTITYFGASLFDA
ncbi:antibiotic biosynthesis monooxygenase family protein [Parasphingopyxis lamellibrachiae]|uniref:Heme-degrading monooxygenase HmoA n=1 Tax=Parasphingopyxis lamellibrachiae TaxID=680125 RepID=A0A3D9FH22_9SPHN|nr:antibiotic biosynthesis monooxygenase [Parasphingopyxis lamellibrachiae]RED17094.1 heme-degrading monooxygenase HmoA [Parasphingopyxis lamellibrachiae]